MLDVLKEIELDFEELRSLAGVLSREEDGAIRAMAKRRVSSIGQKLSTIERILDEEPEARITEEPEVSEIFEEVAVPFTPLSTEIVAEQLKRTPKLVGSLSLNDTFRFSRELFDGDVERMNSVLGRLDEMDSFDEATYYLDTQITPQEDDEVLTEFTDIIKKYFI
ncbi:hypothetical protein [Bacteroides sp. 214]|uniref:hypothetical protein n=1 Tax=Bacteroides sp. 214 TaxID=2302935 RepID=UPI0013D33F26|nr:hypothetical protein [Bacteroides sp. 214]